MKIDKIITETEGKITRTKLIIVILVSQHIENYRSRSLYIARPTHRRARRCPSCPSRRRRGTCNPPHGTVLSEICNTPTTPVHSEAACCSPGWRCRSCTGGKRPSVLVPLPPSAARTRGFRHLSRERRL